MTSAELKDARHRLGLSVGDLARILNIDDRTLRRWEAGEKPPSPTAVRVVGWLRPMSVSTLCSTRALEKRSGSLLLPPIPMPISPTFSAVR